jgi:hypothetical protein
MEDIYTRDALECSTAFWACLRRAFPHAMTDTAEYEAALSNIGLVYAAATETTAVAIAITLAVLAVDEASMREVEQVGRKLMTFSLQYAKFSSCYVSCRFEELVNSVSLKSISASNISSPHIIAQLLYGSSFCMFEWRGWRAAVSETVRLLIDSSSRRRCLRGPGTGSCDHRH